MRRFIFLIAFIHGMTLPAQSVKEELVQNTAFNGYVIGSASAKTQADASKNADMALRLVRFIVSSRIKNVELKLQMQLNGNTSSLSSPRIVDASAEWQPWRELKVKFGQFKRPFTFDNPTNPWNIGLGSFSQMADRLAGFNDRVGEHPSNGRDMGLQLQGDLLPAHRDGHRWLHYQVGVFNGQGINHADKNTRKDLIGGLWFCPIEDLRIGAFGWTGNYEKDGVTVDRNRYAFGLSYTGRWTARAEIVFSEGHKVSDYLLADGTIRRDELGRPLATGSDGADAWYVCIGAPVAPRTKLFARWNVYRDDKTWSTARSLYELTANHYFFPNLLLQANYAFVADKTSSLGSYYHSLDVQLYWRF